MNKVSPIWLVLIAIVSVQVGASFAKILLSQISPISVAWLRAISAVAVMVVLRPKFKGLVLRDWAEAIAFAVCLLGMNWTIYESFLRIPIGIAVTIEFIGPLTLSLVSCRRLLDVLWVFLAGTGVVLLGGGTTQLNWLGAIYALIAAIFWAGYILIGNQLLANWNRVSLIFFAYACGSIVFLPGNILSSGAKLLNPTIVGLGLVVGLLSSALPYVCELAAMKSIPPRIFGVLMSLEPAAAALAALLILHESLDWIAWLAIGCIVAAALGVSSTINKKLAS